MQFKWCLVLVAIIETSVAAIISTGQCQQKKGAKISFTKLNGKQWHEVYEADIPPGQKCMFDVFQTSRNGSTTISRTYTDTSSGDDVTNQGTIDYNPSFGNFSVDLTGYPANGQYWLLDLTANAATFYMCLPRGNNEISETAWILVPNLRFANRPTVINRSKRILEKNGFCSAKLQKVVNTNC